MLAVEIPLRQFLVANIPGIRVVTRLPAQFETGLMPALQIQRIGGRRDFILDHPMVDIEAFALDEESASALMGQVDDLLTYNLPSRVGLHVLGLEGTYSGPSRRNYENTGVWRFGATYGLLLHLR